MSETELVENSVNVIYNIVYPYYDIDTVKKLVGNPFADHFMVKGLRDSFNNDQTYLSYIEDTIISNCLNSIPHTFN